MGFARLAVTTSTIVLVAKDVPDAVTEIDDGLDDHLNFTYFILLVGLPPWMG